MTEPNTEEVKRAKEALAEMTELCKMLVEHPEIIATYDEVQLAWIHEHFELVIEETKKLQTRVERLIQEG